MKITKKIVIILFLIFILGCLNFLSTADNIEEKEDNFKGELIYKNIKDTRQLLSFEGAKYLIDSSCRHYAYLNQRPERRSGYFTDGKDVYFHNGFIDVLIPEADKDTFVCLESNGSYGGEVLFYGKDNKNVYFGINKIDGADPYTFDVLDLDYNNGLEYSKDNKSVFRNGISVDLYDPDDFEFLGSIDNNYLYTKDKNGIYVNNVLFPNSDSKTIDKSLFPYFLKDKNNVYHGDKIVTDIVEPIKFNRVISIKGHMRIDSRYFKDDNVVYYSNGEKLTGADATNFRALYPFLEHLGYDGKSFYKEGIKLINTEYKVLGDLYILNGNKIIGTDITIADPESLYYVGRDYFADIYNVYKIDNMVGVKDGILTGVGPEDFKLLNEDFHYITIENNKVFYISTDPTYEGWLKDEIEADPKSIKIFKWPYYIDKSSVFYYGYKLEKLDVSNFQLINIDGIDFAIDSDSVYHRMQLLDVISPQDIKIEKGKISGLIISDNDTEWYLRGGCYGSSFLLKEDFFKDNFKNWTKEKYLEEYSVC